MSDDYKKEAIRQYLHHFRIWFILVGIMAVVTVGAGVIHFAGQ